MNVYECITSRRTVRKFKQETVKYEDLIKLIECARVAPYGANLQPLKFKIVTDEGLRRAMFEHIKYAGYIPEWNPTFEESPTAFIAVLNDTTIKPTDKSECDSGAAIMSMCLEAEELGLGTCWLGAIDRSEIKNILGLDEKYDVTYLLAVGYPDQKGDVFDMTDSIKYYFDDELNVHVPKRTLDEIIVK